MELLATVVVKSSLVVDSIALVSIIATKECRVLLLVKLRFMLILEKISAHGLRAEIGCNFLPFLSFSKCISSASIKCN